MDLDQAAELVAQASKDLLYHQILAQHITQQAAAADQKAAQLVQQDRPAVLLELLTIQLQRPQPLIQEMVVVVAAMLDRRQETALQEQLALF